MQDEAQSLTPRRPLEPHPDAMKIARKILGARFEADHKDGNAMLAAAREQGMPVEFTFFGPTSMHAKRVIEVAADENLRAAPQTRIKQRIKSLQGKVGASLAASVSSFDPTRLGGRGAAGRQRDRARASEGRGLLGLRLERLQAELDRRAAANGTPESGTPGSVKC